MEQRGDAKDGHRIGGLRIGAVVEIGDGRGDARRQGDRACEEQNDHPEHAQGNTQGPGEVDLDLWILSQSASFRDFVFPNVFELS